MTLISTLQTKDGQVIYLDENAQKKRILDVYNIRNKKLITSKNKDKCFPTRFQVPTAPTLSVLTELYEEEFTESWMTAQIQLLNDDINVKVKLNEMQITTTANVLIDKFSDGVDRLNVREIILFFHNLIGGKYGQFFGAISPDVICVAAEKFLDWRHSEIQRIEREQEYEERQKRLAEMEKNAVPPPPGIFDKINSVISTIGRPEMKQRTLNDIKHIDENHITEFKPTSEKEIKQRNENMKIFNEMLRQQELREQTKDINDKKEI